MFVANFSRCYYRLRKLKTHTHHAAAKFTQLLQIAAVNKGTVARMGAVGTSQCVAMLVEFVDSCIGPNIATVSSVQFFFTAATAPPWPNR